MATSLAVMVVFFTFVINAAAAGYASNISVLYDINVSSTQIQSLLTLIQAVVETNRSECFHYHVHVQPRQKLNLLEIIQTDRRDHVIFVIPCDLCQSTLAIIPRSVTLLCVKDGSRLALATCESSLLVTDLWVTLVRSLSLPKVVVLYNPLTVRSLTTIEDAVRWSHTIVWDAESLPRDIFASNNYRNFILSTYSQQTIDILAKSRELKLFGPEYNWLVDLKENPEILHSKLPSLLQDGDNTAVVVLAKSFPQLAQSEVINSIRRLAGYELPTEKEITSQVFPVLDIFKCTNGCQNNRTLTRVSTVTSDANITDLDDIFPDEFHGFKQRLLKVVTKVYEPFVILDKHPNGTRTYRGVCIEILDALAQTLDFRYELYEVKDGKFGVTNESGHWNGLIGAIARREADIAATGLTVSSDRDQVVDYMFPFWEEPSTVLLKKTKDESKLSSVFQPFKISTWYGLVGSVFATSTVIYFMCSLSATTLGLQEPLASLTDCLWYTYAALLGQGTEKQPESLSSRVVASCWWIIVIVLYAVYTGNLIAFLTVSIPQMPFNTLEGMVQQTEYKFGLEDGIIHMMLFREAKSGVYKDLWQGIQRYFDSVVVKTSEIALKKVKTEKYAFIGEKTFLQARSVNNCDLVMIHEEFFKSSFAFAVTEGWPYKKYFDEAIMSLVEAGFIDHWTKTHSRPSRCAGQTASVDLRPTRLEDTSGLYLVLLFGGLLATLCLLVEHVVYKIGKHRLCTKTTCCTCCRQRVQHGFGAQSDDPARPPAEHLQFSFRNTDF